jgi:protein transport protein SEC23
LIAGFDQEAAAVAMARLVSFKMENEVTIKSLKAFEYFWI